MQQRRVGRGSTLVALVLVALVAASPVAAQDADPSADARPAVGSPAPEGSLLPLDPALVAELESLSSPEALSAAADERRAAEWERAGLAELDPELPAILAELDELARADLATFLAEAPPLDPAASPGPDASASPAPSAEAASRMAFLSAVRPGPGDPGRERILDQGGSFLTSVGQMVGYVESVVADFHPYKGGARDASPPYSRTETTSSTVGGRPVTRSTQYAITSATANDLITFTISLSERYAVPGATPTAAAFDIIDQGTINVLVDTCPDEDGTIKVQATSSGTYTVTGGGLTYRVGLEATDVTTALVNDEAHVASRAHGLRVQRRASGTRPDFAGGAASVESSVDASAAWDGGADGDGTLTTVEITDAEGAEQADLNTSLFGGMLTSRVIDSAIDSAEKVWRAQRCLELEVDPPGKEVDSGSETEITVTIKHKAYEEEVERPVKAVLAGTEKLEPEDQPIHPAEFTYTATSESEGEGTITFSSVSNRGIAEERSETYVVRQRLRLDVDGKYRQPIGPGEANLTYKGRDLRVRVMPGDPQQVSVEGRLQIRGRVVIPLPLGRRCTGSYRQNVDVNAGPDRSARLVGDAEDRRLAVKLMPPGGATTVRVRVRCPAPGMELDQNADGGDFLNRWSTALGEVEIPLSGGTVRARGSSRATGTFTLRDEGHRR